MRVINYWEILQGNKLPCNEFGVPCAFLLVSRTEKINANVLRQTRGNFSDILNSYNLFLFWGFKPLFFNEITWILTCDFSINSDAKSFNFKEDNYPTLEPTETDWRYLSEFDDPNTAIDSFYSGFYHTLDSHVSQCRALSEQFPVGLILILFKVSNWMRNFIKNIKIFQLRWFLWV